MTARIAWCLLVVAVAGLVHLVLFGVPVRDWWRRNRDRRISDLFRRRQPDVYAEDLPRRTPMQAFADFADIAATMPELDEIDKQVAGLYLVPEARDGA